VPAPAMVATVHKYRDVVTKWRISLNLAVLVSSRSRKSPCRRNSTCIKHVPDGTKQHGSVPENSNTENASITSITNKNFVCINLVPSRQLLEPPETLKRTAKEPMDPFGAERGGQCLRVGELRPHTSVPS
jgi:ABC-type uncharacterized transport system ATPase subunit